MVPAIPRTPDRRLNNNNETAEDEMESVQFQAIKDEKMAVTDAIISLALVSFSLWWS